MERGDLDELRARADAGDQDAAKRLPDPADKAGPGRRSGAVAPVRLEPGRVNCLRVKGRLRKSSRRPEQHGDPDAACGLVVSENRTILDMIIFVRLNRSRAPGGCRKTCCKAGVSNNPGRDRFFLQSGL